jgi:hypothetical protein
MKKIFGVILLLVLYAILGFSQPGPGTLSNPPLTKVQVGAQIKDTANARISGTSNYYTMFLLGNSVTNGWLYQNGNNLFFPGGRSLKIGTYGISMSHSFLEVGSVDTLLTGGTNGYGIYNTPMFGANISGKLYGIYTYVQGNGNGGTYTDAIGIYINNHVFYDPDVCPNRYGLVIGNISGGSGDNIAIETHLGMVRFGASEIMAGGGADSLAKKAEMRQRLLISDSLNFLKFVKYLLDTKFAIADTSGFATALRSFVTAWAAAANHNHSGVYLGIADSTGTARRDWVSYLIGTRFSLSDTSAFATALRSFVTSWAAAVGHNHSGVYQPVADSAGTAYRAWVSAMFAAINHAHAGVYQPVADSAGTAYRAWVSAMFSAVGHTHAGTYQPADADLDDLADGTLSGSKIGTGVDAANVSTGTLPYGRLSTTTASEGYVLKYSAAGGAQWRTDSTGGAGSFDSTSAAFLAYMHNHSFGIKQPATVGQYAKAVATDSVNWGDPVGEMKALIRTLPFKDGFDSSALTVGRVRLLGVGNNEIVDTVFVMLLGTSADINFNLYSGTTLGTATDSLFTANWHATGTNAVVTKVTADCRNSGSLGYKYWWFTANSITTKPPDMVIQMKGHLQ